MAVKLYVEAIREGLAEEMRLDASVFVLGEDIGKRQGVFYITEGLLDEFGDQRVLDTPLAESAIVGVAVGASMHGMRPVAEMQFSDFMLPAYNQIVSEAAKMRYRSNNDWSCPLVIRAPYGGGIRGAFYHSQCLEALFHHVPGLKIVAPSTPYDAKGLLIAAIRDDDPVIYFEHKACYRRIRGDVPIGTYVVPIGKADVKRQGSDITVFTYGLMVHYCLEAAEELATEGIDVHVIDLRTLLPLDREAILEGTRRTGKVLIVHEANKTGGIGAEVAAIISQEAFFELDAPIMRLCGPDVPAMPYNIPQEQFYMLNPDKIRAAMKELAQF